MTSPRLSDRFSGRFLDEFIQCSHADKVLITYPCGGVLDEEVLARIYAVPPERYRELRELSARRTVRAASELLGDRGFAKLVDRLPLTRGAVVVAVGDSITDDWQSWARILEELLRQRRPADGITLVNAGMSGDTTTDVLRRFQSIIDCNPDWIIALIGTNDAAAFGGPPTMPLVSYEETARNLGLIRQLSMNGTRARIAWVTPPPISPKDFERFMLLRGLKIGVSNEDLFRNAELVRQFSDPVVDLWPVFGHPPESPLFFDGLHPSLNGHKEIVMALVRRLTEE